uniref:Interleukin 9 receptor n=1 Tax=Jaculus jaculus TaxID=51337 RepID=A0A8C5K8G6_JACJA
VGPGSCIEELPSKAVIWDLGTLLLTYTCVCWGVSVPEQGAGKGPRTGVFTCFSNVIIRIDCHWSAPELARDSDAWLLFTSNLAPGSRHKCTFWGNMCTLVLPPEEMLLPSDNFTITFHHCISGQEQISLVDPEFLPWRHVKLDPPSDLQSNVSSGQCILTWNISPALEPMSTLLSYELAFKRQEETWERARHKDRIVGVTWVSLEAIELNPGSTYEARLRVQMAVLEDDMAEEEHFEGQWSEWSQSVYFPSPQRQDHVILPWGWSESTLVAGCVFLLLTGLSHLLFKLSPRVKRTFYQSVPSPAAFFHSLYSVHNGNFQTWTGTSRVRPQPTQDGVNTPQGGSESSVLEDITVLTYGPACLWQFSSLKKGIVPGFPGFSSSEHVLQADCVELWGQPSAYLPQEDWGPEYSTRPAPPDSEGGSSYYTLGFHGECSPSTLLADTLSSEPTQPQPMTFPGSSRA